MADGEYKISLGVDLKVNDIKNRIKEYNSNSNNAKVKLGVKLDTKGLAEQIKAINYKTPVKISAKLDTKNVQSQINNIKRQIEQLGNIKINLGGVGGRVGGNGRQDIQTVRIARSIDDVTRAYHELLSIQNRLNSKKQAVAKLDTTKNKQEIAELTKQIDNLSEKYQKLHHSFSDKLSPLQTDRLNRNAEITAEKLEIIKNKALDARASLDRMNAGGTNANAANGVKQTANELKKIQLLAREIGKLDFKIGTLDTKANVNQIKELERQLELLKIQYNETAKTLNKNGINGISSVTTKEFVDARNKLAEFEAKLVDTKAKLAKGIKLKLVDGTFNNDVSNIESKFNRLSLKPNEIKSGIKEVKLAMSDMANANNVETLIGAYERYEHALKEVNNQLQINARAEKDSAATQKLKDDSAAFQSKIDAWLTKNSAAANRFGSQLLELKSQAQSCDRVTLNHLEKEFKQIDTEAEAAGLKIQSFGDRLKTQFAKYSSYFSIASLFLYGIQAAKDMFEQVKAIDSAMTELKKVTNETDETYNQFLSNAASRAKEIGTTIDGLVSSTADFARLGYGFEEAQGLAEVANIYAVVGDEIEGVEGATKSLISTLAAFKDEASGIRDTDFAMDIVDKFNEVSNNFAISSGGIGEALERSASSLRAANNTIDESIALITAANTVVQDPATVGTAFKTMSMRIRGAKTEMEELGLDTEGMVDSTAKLREEIMALTGVDIMLNENEFKSTYAIMDELAQKWEDLSDIQQATVTELVAGRVVCQSVQKCA